MRYTIDDLDLPSHAISAIGRVLAQFDPNLSVRWHMVTARKIGPEMLQTFMASRQAELKASARHGQIA